MRKVAIIAAAGWKAAGDSNQAPADYPDFLRPVEGCPHTLLPIGGGETILSRLAGQLKALGFSVYIGIGAPGCLFPGWAVRRAECWNHLQGTVSEEAVRLGREVSPWTQARVNYVASFGTPVLMPDPDNHTVHDTFCRALDQAGMEWDQFLMMHGDTLLRDGILQRVMEQPCPCLYQLTEQENIYWLDREAAVSYRNTAEGVRGGWDGFPGDVHLRHFLGIPIIAHGRDDDWCDVDYPKTLPDLGSGVENRQSYEWALAWMRRENEHSTE